MVLPCEDMALRLSTEFRTKNEEYYCMPTCLMSDGEFILFQILEREVRLQRQISAFKTQLESIPNFDLFQVFKTIDRYNTGKID
jgi:hypothetical protein